MNVSGNVGPPQQLAVKFRDEKFFYYQNMGDMRGSLEDFRNDVANSTYDVIFVTETWLRNDILNQLVIPNGWRLFRNDRQCETKSAHSVLTFLTVF